MSGGFRIDEVDDGLYSIGAGYWSPKLAQIAKQVPGMRFVKRPYNAWVGYIDAVMATAERLQKAKLITELAAPPDTTWPHQLPASYESARAYQRTGIDFCINQMATGCVLADDMGLGKSRQFISAARAFRRHTLIICPNHVHGVWERPKGSSGPADPGGELAKWWPAAKVLPLYGMKPVEIPQDVDVCVIHYEIVPAWVEALKTWGVGTLGIDEGHVLISPTSKRSKAIREIRAEAKGAVVLTGTPPTDKVMDLYNVVDIVSPGRFGDGTFRYGIAYAAGHQEQIDFADRTKRTVWKFDGKSNIDELKRRLEYFLLRRTKRQVMRELPPLTRQVVDVEISASKRIGLSAALVKDRAAMRRALDAAADGKMKHVLELVKGHLRDGLKVVVGTYRRVICENLAEELQEIAPTLWIHGGLPAAKRSLRIDEIARTHGPACLVANIDCTATGVDFTWSSTCVLAELVWEPRDFGQFESRFHRFGARDPVLVQYVIARGTGDELILEGVIRKLDTFLELIEKDRGDGMRESLRGEEDVGLQRLAKALEKMGRKGVAA